MPIYEYRCRKRHTFEVRQSFSDDPVTKCEVCGAPVQRVFRPIAVHFKGSGFYNTDYGTRKRQRENAAASSEESSAKKDSSDGGSDSPAKGSQGSDGKAKSEKASSDGGGKAKDAKPVAAKS